jgi:hypothetical protein
MQSIIVKVKELEGKFNTWPLKENDEVTLVFEENQIKIQHPIFEGEFPTILREEEWAFEAIAQGLSHLFNPDYRFTTWERFSQGEWSKCAPSSRIHIWGQYSDEVVGGDLLGLHSSTSVVLYDALEEGDFTPEEGDLKIFRGFLGFVQGGTNIHLTGWYIKPHP